MIGHVDRAASAALAEKHGVSLDAVVPPSGEQRLELLARVLDRTDVPYPIPEEAAKAYYHLAESGVPFGIGSLSGESVDLAEFENHMTYENLTVEDHLSWACLVADQQATKHKYASREYLRGEEMFEIGGTVIPDYYVLNARIFQQTGWQLAAVSEIIPAHVFFHCHSHKFFPVTTFMRPPGTDYLEEPDIGHDIAGHVSTFTIPEVAQVMNNHGLANEVIHAEKVRKLADAKTDEDRRRIEDEATELLLYAGRLYWFTVEFGLVQEDGALKAFGAGILSSPGETCFSVDSLESNRVLINPSDDRDLLRLATTDYLISEFQKTYFVLENFESLVSLTPERIVSTVYMAKRMPHYTWREIAPRDRVINVGNIVTAPNEKYFQLLAGQSTDECLKRAAIRNLRILGEGYAPECELEKSYFETMPPVPEQVVTKFAEADRKGIFDD